MDTRLGGGEQYGGLSDGDGEDGRGEWELGRRDNMGTISSQSGGVGLGGGEFITLLGVQADLCLTTFLACLPCWILASRYLRDPPPRGLLSATSGPVAIVAMCRLLQTRMLSILTTWMVFISDLMGETAWMVAV